jgi:hypothetical protein
MTPHLYLKIAMWLPLMVPAVAAVAIHRFGLPASDFSRQFAQILVASGIYGGLPYLLLVVYGTWWIDRRPEPELWRRAWRAPLLMLVLWIPVAAAVGWLYHSASTLLAFFVLGASFIIALGYCYVAFVVYAWRAVCRVRRGTGRHMPA